MKKNKKSDSKVINSPDELISSIKVIKPFVWILFFLILSALIVAVVWSSTNTIEVKYDSAASIFDDESNDKNYFILIKDDLFPSKVAAGQDVYVSGKKTRINSINVVEGPIKIDTNSMKRWNISLSMLSVINLSIGDYVYEGRLDPFEIENGNFKVQIVTERILPISLLF